MAKAVMPKSRPKEPVAFARGKAFHRTVQLEWRDTAEGQVTCEQRIAKPDGSAGRVDICVDAGDGLVAVVELKSTNWERMSDSQLRRRVSRYCQQIWEYVESQLREGADVCPGIVLTGLPGDLERVALIESLFGDEGIAVSWQDETIAEACARHGRDASALRADLAGLGDSPGFRGAP